MNPTPDLARTHRRFGTTNWALVVASQGIAGRQSEAARNELCRAYLHPVYAFVRRSGRTPHEAEDLTQAFFARLLEKEWLPGVQESKGRFRSFLCKAVKNFMANERDREMAQKRGGGVELLSLSLAAAEERYAHEPADGATPETLYERRWALALLESAWAALDAEVKLRGDDTGYAACGLSCNRARAKPPMRRSHGRSAWRMINVGSTP